MDTPSNKIRLVSTSLKMDNKLKKLRIATIFRSSCRDGSVATHGSNPNLPPKEPPTRPFPSIHKPSSPKIPQQPDPARQKLSESYSLFYSAHSAPLLEKQSMDSTRKKQGGRKTSSSTRRRKVDCEDDEVRPRRRRRRRRAEMKMDQQHEQEMEDSYAVVKCSRDPFMDFRASMVEMIVEKRMKKAEDLERLLQCFLKLNSYRYHPIIIQAFMDIWDALFL